VTAEDVAAVCHEANRALCQTHGDDSQPPWDEAPDWQRVSAINGVKAHLATPGLSASHSHNLWYEEKEADGWVYGPVKDPAKKQHPCMVDFSKLPPEQQAKDYLFKAVVNGLRSFVS